MYTRSNPVSTLSSSDNEDGKKENPPTSGSSHGRSKAKTGSLKRRHRDREPSRPSLINNKDVAPLTTTTIPCSSTRVFDDDNDDKVGSINEDTDAPAEERIVGISHNVPHRKRSPFFIRTDIPNPMSSGVEGPGMRTDLTEQENSPIRRLLLKYGDEEIEFIAPSTLTSLNDPSMFVELSMKHGTGIMRQLIRANKFEASHAPVCSSSLQSSVSANQSGQEKRVIRGDKPKKPKLGTIWENKCGERRRYEVMNKKKNINSWKLLCSKCDTKASVGGLCKKHISGRESSTSAVYKNPKPGSIVMNKITRVRSRYNGKRWVALCLIETCKSGRTTGAKDKLCHSHRTLNKRESNDVIIWGMSWGEPESGTPACTVVNFSVEDDEIQAAKNHVLHCCCTDRHLKHSGYIPNINDAFVIMKIPNAFKHPTKFKSRDMMCAIRTFGNKNSRLHCPESIKLQIRPAIIKILHKLPEPTLHEMNKLESWQNDVDFQQYLNSNPFKMSSKQLDDITRRVNAIIDAGTDNDVRLNKVDDSRARRNNQTERNTADDEEKKERK
ncbi:uncharacterized protein LOC118434016 isoform X2 [Folsomia candida]|uniref:uncharacterized protein LOC118434016 isoform X2 n=1 Tax=Folsomia candida TaxID=158441 RepID=UPI0016050F1C|nr:uncharacterized protein LOC118434016 isoform X2 [Folsomia candida]